MKPFNLEQAKAGKPVCTRDGNEARIVCFNMKNKEYSIVAIVKDENGIEHVGTYTSDGYNYADKMEVSDDLMMRGEARKGYVALFKSIEGDSLAYCSNVYETPEKVREGIGYADCMGIVEVNWEE